MRVYLFPCIIIGIIVLSASLLQAQTQADPWDFVQSKEENQLVGDNEAVSPGRPLFSLLITVYQEIISPVDGEHCPMYPSCSQYCKESVSEYGLLKGILFSTDRLHRCGHDLKYYPVYYIEGRLLRYDHPDY